MASRKRKPEWMEKAERKERARDTRIRYMGGKVLNERTLEFTIRGTRGDLYTVHLYDQHPLVADCDCPDYEGRGSFTDPCKHVYFLFMKFTTFEDARVALSAPVPVLAAASGGGGVKIKNWVNEMCAICCDVMTKDDTVKSCHSTCGQSIHQDCFIIWKEHQQNLHLPVTCPICRTVY